MNENDIDEKIMTSATRLSPAVEPGRDLWPGIEQAINLPQPRQRVGLSSMWMQAAAVLLLVGASSALTYSIVRQDDSSVTPGTSYGPDLIFESVSAPFGGKYDLGPDFHDAGKELATNLDQELKYLSPSTRVAVLENIRTIRQAIIDINKALAEEPDNAMLQELLLETYRDELSLMKKVGGISSAAMRRDDI